MVSRRQRKEDITGLVFILPYLAGFVIFQGLPFVIAFALGFTNIRYITRLDNARFTGLGNFARMIGDPEALMALARSGIYSAMYIPLMMGMGFLLALGINRRIYGRNIVRTMLFLPYVSNIIAVSAIFKLLLNSGGAFERFLALFGVRFEYPVLFTPGLALPVIVVIAVWCGMGLYMITFLAALQGVPRELIEAALIDGAGPARRIFRVVIPYISPTTFFLLTSAIITSLQNFTIIQAFTGGGPGQATTVLSIKIVQTAFVNYQTGYASAQAIVMFLLVMGVTLIQWKGQKSWVNY
jgi:multiple sugar transport system permease protein